MSRHLRLALMLVPLLAAFWLALVGQLELTEAVAGLIAACLATAYWLGLGRDEAPLRLHPRWVWQAADQVGPIVADTLRVYVRLARALTSRQPLVGRFVRVPFPEPIEGADGPTRFAVATLVSTLAPNAYVVEVDAERREVLLHQLVERPGQRPEDLLWWPR